MVSGAHRVQYGAGRKRYVQGRLPGICHVDQDNGTTGSVLAATSTGLRTKKRENCTYCSTSQRLKLPAVRNKLTLEQERPRHGIHVCRVFMVKPDIIYLVRSVHFKSFISRSKALKRGRDRAVRCALGCHHALLCTFMCVCSSRMHTRSPRQKDT